MDQVTFTILAIAVIVVHVIQIVLAVYFIENPPKEINGWYGYRTPLSMKNLENWQFANRLGSRVMLLSTISALVISILLLIFGKQLFGTVLLLTLLGLIAFISPLISIPIVEYRLRQFDLKRSDAQWQ